MLAYSLTQRPNFEQVRQWTKEFWKMVNDGTRKGLAIASNAEEFCMGFFAILGEQRINSISNVCMGWIGGEVATISKDLRTGPRLDLPVGTYSGKVHTQQSNFWEGQWNNEVCCVRDQEESKI